MTPSQTRSPAPAEPRIAYFSMEVGLESTIPTYSGGLGVLAGDTLRAAADLSLPVVGVSLVHQKGYTRQRIDPQGRQIEAPQPWTPPDRTREVAGRVEVSVGGRPVVVRAWRYDVVGVRGAVVPVYLLDTNLPENGDLDRRLTDHLYGGDARYRLAQETLLGFGGVALLRALGHRKIHTFHLNEGHCSFVPLALLEERVGEGGLAAASRRLDRGVRALCVFTTHTPVPAGHDRFPPGLAQDVLGKDRADALRGRGTEPDGTVNMTELGLHFARFANGVAMRHARVSREMFPGRDIHPITNGVHVVTWASPPIAELFDRHVPEWRVDPLNLRHAIAIPLEELRVARTDAKALLIKDIESRTGVTLDQNAFTIGFARRATAYKRADLLFDDLKRLRALAERAGGLQLVFAGKAHPNDAGGKDLIRRIVTMGKQLKDAVRVIYLEDYDMALGRLVTSGVDLWLNNPEKPKEASGTSGMKAALNGVPNLSVLDGWWIEGHVEGVTGWSIGESWRDASDRAVEATAIYEKLDRVILPLFKQDPDGYASVRRQAMALNGPHFSARRMMHQYVELAYGGWLRLGARVRRAPRGIAGEIEVGSSG
jgi:starch phosphorylase